MGSVRLRSLCDRAITDRCSFLLPFLNCISASEKQKFFDSTPKKRSALLIDCGAVLQKATSAKMETNWVRYRFLCLTPRGIDCCHRGLSERDGSCLKRAGNVAYNVLHTFSTRNSDGFIGASISTFLNQKKRVDTAVIRKGWIEKESDQPPEYYLPEEWNMNGFAFLSLTPSPIHLKLEDSFGNGPSRKPSYNETLCGIWWKSWIQWPPLVKPIWRNAMSKIPRLPRSWNPHPHYSWTFSVPIRNSYSEREFSLALLYISSVQLPWSPYYV